MCRFICTFASKFNIIRKRMMQRDYLEWYEMEEIIPLLIKDKKYLVGLLIMLGCITGMKANDMLALKWCDILKDNIVYKEISTGRYIKIGLSKDTQNKIKQFYKYIGSPDVKTFCFVSKKKSTFSIQRINVLLKDVSHNYLDDKLIFTTTSLRRTFGREIHKRNGPTYLNPLRIFFNQISEEYTKKYLRLYSDADISFPTLWTSTQKW